MLQPERNHFSVAPLAGIVMIGRHTALRSGITREAALNLIGWLIIATEASPQEIRNVIHEARVPVKAVSAPLPPVQQIEKEAPFIGTIDAEEQAGIELVKAQVEAQIGRELAAKSAPASVDDEKVANDWGAK